MDYRNQIIFAILFCFIGLVTNGPFKKYPWPLKLTLIWIFFSGTIFSMKNLYPRLDILSQDHIRIIAANSLNFTLIPILFIFLIDEKLFKKICDLSFITIILSSVYIIIKKFLGYNASALNYNTSTEGTYLAIMTPMALYYDKLKIFNKSPLFYLRFTPLIAVFLTTSSVGIFGAIFSLAIIYLIKKPLDLKRLAIISISIIICVLISYLHVGQNLFSDTHRIEQWKISMDWWTKYANHYFGTGLGTYWGFGPMIQNVYKSGLSSGYFVNAHNDWLQLIFELGLIGYFLTLFSFASMLKNALKRDNIWLFSSIATFGLTAAMNMPLRYPLIMISGLILVRMAYSEKNEF